MKSEQCAAAHARIRNAFPTVIAPDGPQNGQHANLWRAALQLKSKSRLKKIARRTMSKYRVGDASQKTPRRLTPIFSRGMQHTRKRGLFRTTHCRGSDSEYTHLFRVAGSRRIRSRRRQQEHTPKTTIVVGPVLPAAPVGSDIQHSFIQTALNSV